MTAKTKATAIICAAMMAAAALTACTQGNGSVTSDTTSAQSGTETAATELSTEESEVQGVQSAATDSSSSQDSQLSLAETTTDLPSQVIVSNEVYIQELCASQWYLRDVYQNGERIDNYYGTVANTIGKYMTFSEDGSFQCTLGQNSCNGTYIIDTGVVTVHIENIYKPTSKDPEYSGESQTLIWDRNGNTLQFDFVGVTNVFVR